MDLCLLDWFTVHKDRMRLPSGKAVAHSQGLKPTAPLPPPVPMFTNKLNYGEISPLFHRQSIVLFLVTIGPNASQRWVAKRLQRWLVLLQGHGSFKLFQWNENIFHFISLVFVSNWASHILRRAGSNSGAQLCVHRYKNVNNFSWLVQTLVINRPKLHITRLQYITDNLPLLNFFFSIIQFSL